MKMNRYHIAGLLLCILLIDAFAMMILIETENPNDKLIGIGIGVAILLFGGIATLTQERIWK